MPVFGAIREDTLHFLLDQVQGWRGAELLLHSLRAGDCFGEMALLDLFPRSASVRAETDCEAMALSCVDLYRLFERDAEQFALIQMNIGRELSRRLRLVDDLLFRARVGGEVPAPAELVLQST